MNLIKEVWTERDIKEYKSYVLTLKADKNNCFWEQRIVNTKLECFGCSSSKARKIAKEIKKGNYISFLENFPYTNHMDSLVIAFLINDIKDFKIFKKYLLKFSKKADNWSSCDTLKFQKQDKSKLLLLAKQMLKSNKVFERRIGVDIFFELIKDEKYLKDAFEVLDFLKDEEEYYVNMCGAWLLCECFAKNKEKTIGYYENNKTNSFIINKSISKCRDSFRITKEDKELLKRFKK